MKIITVETIEALMAHFGLTAPGRITVEDVDLEENDTDRNGRRRRDAEVLTTLGANSPGRILEIGTSYGHGTYKLAANQPAGGTVITVNVLPEQISESANLVTHLIGKDEIGSFWRAQPISNVEQVYAETMAWMVPDRLRGLDAVFVDGCHDTVHVRSDSHLLYDRVREDGFMLWHDFNPGLRTTFGWIDEVMRGIELFEKDRGFDLEIVHLRHSFMGLHRVVRRPATPRVGETFHRSDAKPDLRIPEFPVDPAMRRLRFLKAFTAHDQERLEDEMAHCGRLREWGWDVEGFCLTIPGLSYAMPDLDRAWKARDPRLLEMYDRLGKALQGKDVFVLWTGAMIHPDLVASLKSTYNVYVCSDDPESSAVLSRPVAPLFDYAFTRNLACVEDYRRWGCRNAKWLCPPVDADYAWPDLDRRTILEGERPLDVVMFCERILGLSDRAVRLEKLRQAFPQALLRGKGWEGGYVSRGEMLAAYRSSKIGWNLHNSIGPTNSRLATLPAFGVMEICDNASNLARVFRLDREIVGFESIEECIDKTQYYLAHDRERREIAAAGWERFTTDFTQQREWERIAHKIQNEVLIRMAAQMPSKSAPAEPATRKRLLIVVDEEAGHVTAHIRGHMFVEPLSRKGWKATVLDARKDPRERILEEAAESSAVLLAKVPSLDLVSAIKDSAAGPVVYDFTDALWLSFHQAHGWQDIDAILREADAIVCDNRRILQYALRQNPCAAIWPASTRVELFDQAAVDRPPRNGDKIRIGWVGSQGTASAIAGIAAPLSRVAARHPGLELRILGCSDPSALPMIPGLATTCLGSYDEPAMIDEILDMDIGLFPAPASLEDFQNRGPLKGLLYMSGAIPCICQRGGELDDILRHGTDGYLVDSPEGWEEALEKLLESREARERMGRSARSRVSDRALDPITDILIERIESAMAAGSTDPRALSNPRLQAPNQAPTPRRPRILCIADVRGWIFERHARTLQQGLADRFQIDIAYQGEPVDDSCYDLVYPLEWNLVPLDAIRDPNKWVTGIRSHVSWEGQDPEAFSEVLRTRFQAVHAVSQRLCREIVRFRPDVVSLTHGVDTEHFSPRRSPFAQPGRVRVGWAGNRKSPVKGFEEFIAPLQEIPGVEIHFCGYSDTLLDKEQMKAFHEDIDVYVCSSKSEGSNNSLLEAAAMGRAIVTTDVGTVPEYLRDGESALIVERTPAAFREALERIVADPARARALGESARRAVAEFSWKRKLEDHAVFFERALRLASPESRRSLQGRLERADSDLTAGRTEEALETLRALVSELGERSGVSARIARALVAAGRLSEAHQECMKATRVWPDLAAAHSNLAGVLVLRGQHERACASLERVLQLQPGDPEALFALGRARMVCGDETGGARALTDLVIAHPDHDLSVEARILLVGCGLESPCRVHPPTSGIGCVPMEYSLALDRAEALLREGLPAQALSLFLAAQKAKEDDPVLLCGAAQCWKKMGDRESARSFLDRALYYRPSSPTLAEMRQGLGELPDRDLETVKTVRFQGPVRIHLAMLTYNALPFTKMSLESIVRTTRLPYRIHVRDNLSGKDGTRAWLAAQEASQLHVQLGEENLGVPGGRNELMDFVLPEVPDDGFVVFVDNDMEFFPGWETAALEYLDAHPEVGVLSSDGHRLWIRGEERVLLPKALGTAEVDVACGGYVCWIRGSVLRAVGGFDENLGLFWHEDDDFTLHAKAQGWKTMASTQTPVLHHGHQSGSAIEGNKVQENSPKNMAYLAAKWRAMGMVRPDGAIRQEPLANPPRQVPRMPRGRRVSSGTAPAQAPVPLHWIAPALNFTGYARLNREAMLSLEAGGNVLASLDPSVNDPEFIKGLEAQGTDEVAPWNRILSRRPSATGLCLVSDIACNLPRLRASRPGFARYAGLTMFETDRLPEGWADYCLEMDEIWVPSTFNLRTFAASGVPEGMLRRIPCGIDMDRFRPGASSPLRVAGRRRMNFLSVFDWTLRKGWDVLLAAWAEAFTASDDVSLTLKVHKSGAAPGEIGRLVQEFYTRSGVDPTGIAPVIVVEGFLPESAMPALYAAAEVFVLPTRGEGWGLPYLEAMASGLPVIATGWSSHLDFATSDNAYLVDHRLVPVHPEQTRMSAYYGADHLWAEPSREHLVELLRERVRNPGEARERGIRARSDVQEAWSSRRTAEWIARNASGAASSPTPAFSAAACAPNFRIGFDGRTFSVPDSMVRGIGHYSLHHLLAVLAQRPGQNLTVLLDDREPIPSDVRSRLEAAGARFAAWSSRTSADFDLVHVADPMYVHPEFASPFQRMGGTRLSATVYDVTPLRMYAGRISNWPGYLARLDALRDSGAQALCISEHTRRDLLDAIQLPPGRATTVMAGFNASFSERRWSREEGDALLRRLGIDRPFFLHVGAVDPHKNFETVLSACQTASTKHPCLLVVVGKIANSLSAVRDQVLHAGIHDVVFTDFLPREELELLYSRAVATLFLSRYEGFGFPVLEAMAQGCPVVCSDSTSIPEVAGNAALVHSPDDMQGIVRSMLRLADSPNLRQEMSERGRSRSAMFPWKAVAQRTWAAWDALLSGPVPAAKPVAAAARVQWVSPVWDPSGYADESRAFVEHLAHTDLGVGLVAWGRHSESFRQAATPEDRKMFDGLMGREMEPNRPVVMDIPVHALGRLSGAGHHVGRTTFETDSLPPDWVARCNSMDEIWVPCAFNKDTFAKAGVSVPILVVPEGVDVDKFRPGLEPLPLPGPSRKTTFLAVFEWTHRKGPDLLLRAWAEAFGPGDDVRLVLRTYPPNQIEGDPSAWVDSKIEEELVRHGRTRADCAPIAVMAQQVPDAEMPRLYAAADIFVAPSRGEGWGRPHMEAMSCGVPVVATRWSGNLEFQDDNNSWLIDVPHLEEINAREEFPFYRGQKWASPSADHLREILVRAANHPEERRTKGERARRDMVEKWDWRKIAPLAEIRLREILAGVAAGNSQLARRSIDASPAVRSSSSTGSGTAHPVRWCGQLFNYSGYARLAREAVGGLMDLGVAVTADPLLNDKNWFPGLSPVDRSRWTGLLSRTPEPGVLVCCDVPRDAKGNELFEQMEAANPGCAKRVGWTMFETDRLPAGWADSLNRLDEVWVPSEFNRRTFADAGVRPDKLHVVPGSVDPAPYFSASPMALPGPARGTTFLSVFQWTRRKGWDVLLRAWAKAFDPKADVRLVLRCHPFGAPAGEMRDIYRRGLEELGLVESSMAPIVFLDDFLPESAMPSLFAASDVFVLPSRGEGWGLPYLEAMAAGKPCIATAWGASLAFLNDGNAWLAAPRQLVPVGDAACRENLYLSPEHRWADPDPAQVSELLRRAASNVVERLTKGQQALQDAVSRWTPRHTAAAIAERIEALRSDRPRPLAPPNKTVLAVSGGRLSSSLEKVAAGLRTTSVAKRPSAVAPAPVVPAPSTATTDSVLSVRWEGSQFVHHSLAHVNRALCLRLAKMGHDLSIRPFEPDQFGPGDDPDLSILTKLHNAPLEGPCQVHVRQTWPPNLEAPAQGKWVVIQPWEFGSPPVDWIAPFRDQVDEIWAYTECVKRVYVEAGIPESQVRVVPLGVDTESFRPGLKPLPGLERDGRLTFLYVGGTIARKGFDVLLNAWRQAFGPSDNVRLVVKAMGGDTFYKGQTGEAMVREINASGKSAPVVYFDQDLSPVNLPRIYASGDVLVHPYRGEGFGLPIAEAMASGLPVVVTRGGASDDFCGENESWGISAKRVPVPGGKVGPFETVVPPWWLEPSVEELAETLRKIAKDEAGRKAKGEAARRRILSGWTWDHAARAAESALREIAAKPVARRDGGKSSDVPNAQLNASDEAALTGLNKILFRAEAAAARGEMGEAESATREAVQAHPDQPLAWLARAMILRGLKKFPAASESVLKSIALKESPEALLESVLIHRLCGQDARAKVAEKTLKGSHSAWLAATRALYNAKGQSWPLDSPAKAVKKSVAPPLKGRR